MTRHLSLYLRSSNFLEIWNENDSSSWKYASQDHSKLKISSLSCEASNSFANSWNSNVFIKRSFFGRDLFQQFYDFFHQAELITFCEISSKTAFVKIFKASMIFDPCGSMAHFRLIFISSHSQMMPFNLILNMLFIHQNDDIPPSDDATDERGFLRSDDDNYFHPLDNDGADAPWSLVDEIPSSDEASLYTSRSSSSFNFSKK